MRRFATAWLDLLLPPACFRCGAPGRDALCRACLHALPPPPPLPAGAPLSGLAAGAAYRGEVEGWVRRFKYPGAGIALDPAPEAVLEALLRRAAEALPRPALVVPVPLHPRRLRARGFNPAGRLSRALARGLGLPWDPVALIRVRETRSQTGLGAAERRRNVAGAFAPARALPEAVRAPGGSVWLVDDVVTTGSTVRAAARALRRGGARRIHALAAAGTP